MDELPVTIADVEAGASRIAGSVIVTPTAFSATLSEVTGAQVWVKFENLQFTSSFKERGALNRLLLLHDDEKRRGVVAASAGNHAQAVAVHASRLGISAVIVMPEHTPNVKVARTEALGASVVLGGDTYEDAARTAGEIARTERRTLIHPFDDPAVIAGQGTVALEMLAAVPGLECIVAPVGGGGLLSGIAIAAKATKPEIEIIGVRAAERPTVAEGVSVKEAGARARVVLDALVDDLIEVSETSIEEAIGLYLEVEKTVAEGAGAVALAALLEHPERFAGMRVGVVLSGGNLDLSVLSTVIVRLLTRTGRLLRLRVELDDVPGALARLTAMIGEQGANIIELVHRRDLPELRLRRALVDLTVETRGNAHAREIVERLDANGVTHGPAT